MHAYRSHTCGALRASDAGSAVRLSGWVHRKRDHGGLLFIDLRDHYGLTQLVLHPETPGFAAVERLRAESVIRIDGEVVGREAGTINANLPTGEIEVRVQAVEVLSEAAELPLPVFGEPEYPEEIRLKHRYLDLRRETLHKNIVLRSRVIQSIRNRMFGQGFLSAISNPKALLFYGAFLPQFLDPALPFWSQMAVFEATFVTLAFLNAFAYAGYVWLIAAAGASMSSMT